MRRKEKKWLLTIGGLLLIILSALVIRAFKINLIPVFADEAIYVRWAQIMRAETTLRFLPLSDGKQPLFMWAVMPALKLFTDPLVAGRAVSIAAGIGTTIGVFVLTYVLFKSRKASLLASLLYALSPFAIFFDRMALVDSMLSMFGVWTFVFAILAIRNLRLDFAFLAGFSLGGAMLTKSPSIFFAVLLPSLIIFIPWRNKESRKMNIIKGILLLGTTLVMGYAIYNVLRLGPNFHLVGSRNFDYVYPYSHIFESPLNPLIGHLERVFEWFISMGPWPVIIMALAGIFGNLGKFKKEVFILTIWIAAPLLVQSEFAKVLTSRYIFFTLPFVMVLAASILKKFKKTPQLYGVYALVALFILQSAMFLIPFFHNPEKAEWPEREGYLSNWTAGTGIKEVSIIIKEVRDANPDKQIVVGTEGYFGTLPDGLQIYLEKEARISVIGIGLGIYEIPESLRNAKEAGDIVYILANDSRLNFTKSFEESGLRIVDQFEKTPRDEGSHSYIQDGPIDTLYLFEVI